MQPLVLAASHGPLANALGRHLNDLTGREVLLVQSAYEALAGTTLITTTTDCSPDECSGLVQAGRTVIILASLPSAFQEGLYRDAGAHAYLPISFDTSGLVDAVATAP